MKIKRVLGFVLMNGKFYGMNNVMIFITDFNFNYFGCGVIECYLEFGKLRSRLIDGFIRQYFIMFEMF